jgi:hypothetical protein
MSGPSKPASCAGLFDKRFRRFHRNREQQSRRLSAGWKPVKAWV